MFFLSWKRWCTVQYCKQCTVRSTPFMHMRYGVLKDMALASRTLEDSFLEASWPRPWSWVSSSWSWPWTASPWTWSQTISSWPSPWVPSPWSWPWAISPWPWPWTVSPWPCPWKLSLTLPWTFKFSGNQPSTGLHSHKCQKVLRFHSRAVLFSWFCGFMESGPARSRFPFTPSPAGKIFCSTATSVLVERVFGHSGLFMRPHCGRMGDRTLSDLVLLKCNKHV